MTWAKTSKENGFFTNANGNKREIWLIMLISKWGRRKIKNSHQKFFKNSQLEFIIQNILLCKLCMVGKTTSPQFCKTFLINYSEFPFCFFISHDYLEITCENFQSIFACQSKKIIDTLKRKCLKTCSFDTKGN